ncbi:PAS domain-containing sensor histidine kinase [Jeongeupia sp. HS-3]|uniref:sensor histidine kinase n=1 Tax=Jeongeupia sp. HS-3 TaxID=1009682 RepID=UPI0018A3652E|nr:HAMP domain-containing sensor histidine kinase [Jeongeupia sp. HS-3]BCL75827.1 PAS domain-containing sensor histidine kinase [Jeongeupia sp. HS-3]
MAEPGNNIDPRELEAAFSLFTEASQQLANTYAELQQQAVSLTAQLEIANGHLRRELDEKGALSRRLAILMDRLPGGIVELDAAGRVTMLNVAARTMLAPLTEGMDWQTFSSAKLEERGGDIWLYPGERVSARLRIVGTNVPEEACRILLVQDLTETWALEQSLAQHKRLAAMGEMAAGLAHQLRTPLATALLYVGHLARPAIVESDRLRFADKTLLRLRHLESLIQDMLHFVRGNAQGGNALELMPVLLDDCLAEAAHTIEPQLDAKRMRLAFMPLGSAVRVRADRKELIGVVLNLLENAMQASEDGACIGLSVFCDQRFATVTVQDEGRGIAPEAVDRLFEPFYTTRKDGTGLGLAIVRSLVERFGGDISVRSVLGEGTEFHVRLPVLDDVSNV